VQEERRKRKEERRRAGSGKLRCFKVNLSRIGELAI
jgi:hypothetical protein